MNTTALRLEKTLRAIGETWAKDAIALVGAARLSDMANVQGYGPLIEKSPRAMAAIETLKRDNPGLRLDHALFLAGNGAAVAVHRSAGHAG